MDDLKLQKGVSRWLDEEIAVWDYAEQIVGYVRPYTPERACCKRWAWRNQYDDKWTLRVSYFPVKHQRIAEALVIAGQYGAD